MVALLILCGIAYAGSLTASSPPPTIATHQWSGLIDSPAAAVLDRFTSVASPWLELDVPATATSTGAAATGLTISATGAGFTGVYRPISTTGDRVITVYGGVAGIWDLNSFALCVAEDLTAAPTTADLWCLIQDGSADDPYAIDLTTYNAVGSVDDTLNSSESRGFRYFRICISDTTDDGQTADDTLRVGMSQDALIWEVSASSTFTVASVTPVHLFVGVNGSTRTGRVLMWREDASNDCFLPVGGLDN